METPEAISNAEFGRRTGYHFTTASRIFSGLRTPSLEKLRVIAAEFEIPINELVEHHATPPAEFGPWLRSRVTQAVRDQAKTRPVALPEELADPLDRARARAIDAA